MGPSLPPPSRSRGPRPTPRPVAPSPRPVERSARAVTERPAATPNGAARRAALGAPAVARPGYLPGLDGLRAVAVFAVVAYHLGELPGGFLGVDVFFVISGFLITRLLLGERERTGGIALGQFWIRRFKRLVPALLVVLVAVAIASKLWLPAFRLTAIRLDAFAALAYVANWRFVLSGQSYFGSGLTPSPLRHTWSLAIEEQFYLLWPLLVVGVTRLAKGRTRQAVGVLAGVGAVASAAWMALAVAQGRDLSRIYYGTDTRAFAIFAGAWLAAWWDPARSAVGDGAEARTKAWAAVGLAALVPSAALIALAHTDQSGFYQGGFQAMTVLSVLVVAGVATDRGVAARAFSTPVLLWLGRRSYGIYLWSWPIQVVAQEHFRLEGIALDAAVVGLSVAMAALSFWLVEEPVRTGRLPAGLAGRLPRSGTPRRVPSFAVPALSVVVVLAVIMSTSAGAPAAPTYTEVSDQEALDVAVGGPLTQEEADFIEESATSTTLPADAGPPGPFANAATFVVDPSASVDPSVRLGRPLEVMIAGDSVGWSLGWTLGPTLTPTVSLEDRALIGCGLMPPEAEFIVGDRDPEPYGEICDQADLAEVKGLSQSPDAVLLWAGAWEVYDQVVDGERLKVGSKAYAAYLEERIQFRVDRYKGVGAVTIMPLVPCFAPNATRLGEERHDAERLEWVNARIRAVAKRNRDWVRLVKPQDQLCDAEGEALTATADGIPLREDGAHFDPPAAVWFWNSWLAGQLGAAFDVAPPPTE